MSETYQRFRSEVLAGGATEADGGAGPSTDERTNGLGGIAVIVGLLVLLGIVNHWALVFVVGLLISVLLHEVGHFVTARRTGMKVTQFFLGMGPRLWSTHRGEVEYGVRAFPIGAFVRIVGMNALDPVDPADEPRAYRNQSYPRRMLVITAGSIMHILIAIVILFGVFAAAGRYEETGMVRVGSVEAGTPAAQAGLRDDDVVRAIDGTPVRTAEEFVSTIRGSDPGSVVTLAVERDGQPLELRATLGQNPQVSGQVGYLGVTSDSGGFVDKSVAEAAGLAFTDLGPQAWNSAKGVFKALNPLNSAEHLTGTSDDPTTRPTTVVGVTKLSGEFGDEGGVVPVLLILAGVNVFVAVFNLFPLLPFDGGHAAIATYERLRSRHGRRYQADVNKMMPVAMAVMVLLAFLLFTGLYLDITNKPL